MDQLEDSMIQSLCDINNKAVRTYSTGSITEWIFQWPAMISFNALCINWTGDTENALKENTLQVCTIYTCILDKQITSSKIILQSMAIQAINQRTTKTTLTNQTKKGTTLVIKAIQASRPHCPYSRWYSTYPSSIVGAPLYKSCIRSQKDDSPSQSSQPSYHLHQHRDQL